MVTFQSFLTRGALNADRDLRRHDLLAPPTPLAGGEHQSAELAVTVSDGEKTDCTTKQQRFSPNKTAAVKINHNYEDEYAEL